MKLFQANFFSIDKTIIGIVILVYDIFREIFLTVKIIPLLVMLNQVKRKNFTMKNILIFPGLESGTL